MRDFILAIFSRCQTTNIFLYQQLFVALKPIEKKNISQLHRFGNFIKLRMSVPDTRSIEKSVTTKVSQSFNNGNKNF
jgi:hypothetical protein